MEKLKRKIARQIIFFNSILIPYLILLRLLGGFDDDEFTAMITLFASLWAIYIGTLFKYIAETIRTQPISSHNQTDIEHPMAAFVPWIVRAHFILLMGIISAKAYPVINFKEMNVFLGLVETSFGGYMGYIIHAMYGISEEDKAKTTRTGALCPCEKCQESGRPYFFDYKYLIMCVDKGDKEAYCSQGSLVAIKDLLENIANHADADTQKQITQVINKIYNINQVGKAGFS